MDGTQPVESGLPAAPEAAWGADGAAIARQIKLPLSKAWEISFNSIRIRFWRSLITAGGIVLAIAFLMATRTSGATAEAIRTELPRAIQAEQVRQAASPGAAARPASVERLKQLKVLRLELLKRGAILDEPGAGEGSGRSHEAAGEAARQHWLAALALLVAFVGIMNAMLMSVTERFREIGTMKCLGALDNFIVKLFLIESSMQGFLGTALGVLLGFALSLAKLWWDYQSGILGFLPWGTLGQWALLALAIGTGLSFLGALLPAYFAAKMEPVVAMRVDQ